MLQKSTRGRRQKLKIDRIALKFFFLLLQLFKSSNFAFMKKIHFLLRNIIKTGLVFFQPRYKSLHIHACIVSYRRWYKSNFYNISEWEMKFFHKSKIASFKKFHKWKKKKFKAIRSILSFSQCPLVDFWSIRNFYGKTDYMGKISKVSMCLKHIQSPRWINFWVFSLSN